MYNLSSVSETKVQNAFNNIKRNISEGEPIQACDGVAISEYRKILCLELDKHSKDNIVKVIDKVKEMDGVEYACPDYVIKACSIRVVSV